jgi:DNA-binding GntR family transcriptional regulator
MAEKGTTRVTFIDPSPETASDTAYRQIRHDIMFGRLKPGTRLRLEQLRTSYGASVSTLREILFRLSVERFVLAEGQRGFEVAPVSQEDFREIASMRELLEGYALIESFQRGDLEWEARVVAAHHKLSRYEARMLSGEEEATEAWKHYDREFHRAMIDACGSEALLAAHSRIFDLFVRYQVIAVIFRGAAAADEHRRFLNLALKRNHADAVALLRQHISACVEHTTKNGILVA